MLVNVATVRFAAPGGSGSASACEAAEPCSLFNAANSQAPGTTILPGAEVVLEPGEYKASAGELGPAEVFGLIAFGDIHGVSGQPRPVINLDRPTSFGLTTQIGELSHVEIVSAAASINLFS